MSTSIQFTSRKILTISATLQILAASFIAIVVLYGVGFNEMDIAHNSAHDARHSAVFPCH
jgi:cobalt transporter subunit CbtB